MSTLNISFEYLNNFLPVQCENFKLKFFIRNTLQLGLLFIFSFHYFKLHEYKLCHCTMG